MRRALLSAVTRGGLVSTAGIKYAADPGSSAASFVAVDLSKPATAAFNATTVELWAGSAASNIAVSAWEPSGTAGTLIYRGQSNLFGIAAGKNVIALTTTLALQPGWCIGVTAVASTPWAYATGGANEGAYSTANRVYTVGNSYSFTLAARNYGIYGEG